jgi:hypothetical protein
MIARLLAAGILVAVSLSAPAQAQQASSRSSDYRQKKVCKVEGTIGSRLGGKRTCRTQAEWDELARENRTVVEHFQAYTHPCLSGGNVPGSPAVNCSSGGP